jgi:hypothetical protein
MYQRTQELVQAYNNLPDEQKPHVLPGVPMVCAAYYTAEGGVHSQANEEMDDRLERFKIISHQNPVHCLVQCQKLGEGYDQPNISVAGLCAGITKLSKFAQFSGMCLEAQTLTHA